MTEEYVSFGVFGCQSLSIMLGLSTSLSLWKNGRHCVFKWDKTPVKCFGWREIGM